MTPTSNDTARRKRRMRNGHEKHVPMSADYVPGGTYPAEICVLRYALERHARTKPDEIFAAFEGGERWTFAQLAAAAIIS